MCTTWLVHKKTVYLIDVLRKRLEFPALKRAVVEMARKFNPSTILIEDKASGIQLIQELRHEGLHMVRGVKPEGDKRMRMLAQTATIENGLVHMPTEAPWLPDYITEMTSFPMCKFDDQVDSTSQALGWLASELWKPGMGIFNYYRDLHEQGVPVVR